MNAKYKVYIDPQVITASGAQPRSVIESSIPVAETNLFNAGPNDSVKSEIIALIPARATAVLRPPSRDLEIGALNIIPSKEITINIIAGPPNPIKKEKPF